MQGSLDNSTGATRMQSLLKIHKTNFLREIIFVLVMLVKLTHRVHKKVTYKHLENRSVSDLR